MRTMEYKTGFMKYFVCVCLIQWCGGGGASGNDIVWILCVFHVGCSEISCGITVYIYHTKPSTLVLVGLYKQDNQPENTWSTNCCGGIALQVFFVRVYLTNCCGGIASQVFFVRVYLTNCCHKYFCVRVYLTNCCGDIAPHVHYSVDLYIFLFLWLSELWRSSKVTRSCGSSTFHSQKTVTTGSLWARYMAGHLPSTQIQHVCTIIISYLGSSLF